MVLIEGCSSVRMDEGGIEPFKQGGGDSALCLYRPSPDEQFKKIFARCVYPVGEAIEIKKHRKEFLCFIKSRKFL